MVIKNWYLINDRTVMLAKEYDHRGICFARVIEGLYTFLVSMSPEEIIKESLKHEVADINGILNNSELLVAKKPICINKELGIILFPTQSLKKQNSEWFSLMHVKGKRALGMRRTEICTSFGHILVIDSKPSTFIIMEQRAYQYRKSVSKETNGSISYYLEPKGLVSVKNDPDENTAVLKR